MSAVDVELASAYGETKESTATDFRDSRMSSISRHIPSLATSVARCWFAYLCERETDAHGCRVTYFAGCTAKSPLPPK
jgi:hypothetical protein